MSLIFYFCNFFQEMSSKSAAFLLYIMMAMVILIP